MVFSRFQLALGIALWAAAVGGCRPTQSLDWQFSLADGLRDETVILEAAILVDGCNGSTVLESEIFPLGSASTLSPTLNPGTYGFRVRARDESCRWFAAGCSGAQLPLDGDAIQVAVVSVDEPDAACAPDACEQGRCRDEVIPDAGVPDAAVVDADANGPDAPACSGCIDDEGSCQPGNVFDACGHSGGSCTTCCEGDMCRLGRCEPVAPATGVATGALHSCAIQRGQLYCWGAAGAGQLGDGAGGGARTTPSRVSNSGWSAVDAQGESTCAQIGSDHYCWGTNWTGQIGNNTLSPSPVPIQVDSPGGVGWRGITGGGDVHCALLNGASESALYCWGYNQNGNIDPELGSAVLVPSQSGDGRLFTQVSAGELHACGVNLLGQVHCWGRNVAGAVGNGTVGGLIEDPVEVFAPGGGTWSFVEAGQEYSCGATAEGDLYCWGCGETDCSDCSPSGSIECTGRLGFDTAFNEGEPGGTPILRAIVRASLWTHACAIDDAQRLYCWGDNDNGQTGQEPSRAIVTPQLVPGSWTQAAVGGPGGGSDRATGGHTCAIDDAGAVFCWGANGQGQLGQGDGDEVPVRSSAPLRVCIPPLG